jgi:hypothetical protein
LYRQIANEGGEIFENKKREEPFHWENGRSALAVTNNLIGLSAFLGHKPNTQNNLQRRKNVFAKKNSNPVDADIQSDIYWLRFNINATGQAGCCNGKISKGTYDAYLSFQPGLGQGFRN